MSGDYLIDPSAPPEDDIRALEETLAVAAYKEPLDWKRVEDVRREQKRPSRSFLIAGALLAAAAALLFLWLREDSSPSVARLCESAGDQAAFRVEAISGTPRCGGDEVTSPVVLAAGAWLATDKDSRVKVAVAEVGEISLEPDSKLKLVKTGPDEHRFDLERGRIHASVDAPPRLFVVSTANAEAVDLGCEYDLSVDDDGAAELVVTGGSVSLEGDDRAVLVPTGYRAKTLVGKGPTPAVPIGASDAYFEAAVELTRSSSEEALEALISEATAETTLTLVGTIHLTRADQCDRVHARLQEVSPVQFPWQQTKIGCDNREELATAWTTLLEQTW